MPFRSWGSDLVTTGLMNGYIQQQVVATYNDESDRNTQCNAPVEGMLSYLKNKDRLELYFNGPFGLTWTALSGGAAYVASNGTTWAWNGDTSLFMPRGVVPFTFYRAGDLAGAVTAGGTAGNPIADFVVPAYCGGYCVMEFTTLMRIAANGGAQTAIATVEVHAGLGTGATHTRIYAAGSQMMRVVPTSGGDNWNLVLHGNSWGQPPVLITGGTLGTQYHLHGYYSAGATAAGVVGGGYAVKLELHDGKDA